MLLLCNSLTSYANICDIDSKTIVAKEIQIYDSGNLSEDEKVLSELLRQQKESIAILKEAILNARNASLIYAEAATKAAIEGDFQEAKKCSFLEIAHYPIVHHQNVKIRIYDSDADLKSLTTDIDHPWQSPFSSWENTLENAANTKYFTFFKAIKREQVCIIKKHGLDTLFGGQGGASETLPAFNKLTTSHDRGRMFFSNQYQNTLYYKKQFEDKGFLSAELKIIIPASQALALNLVFTPSGEENFIAGTKIPPEWIGVKDPFGKYTSITRYICN